MTRRLVRMAVVLGLLSTALLGCSNEQMVPENAMPSPHLKPEPTVPTRTSLLRYVSPTGDDHNAGTYDHPWRTLSYAFARLYAGEVLFVHGGTYRERIDHVPLHVGQASAPITVLAFPGESPVVAGSVSLQRPEHWLIDNLDVQGTGKAGKQSVFMVRVIGGQGWAWQNSEFSDTVGRANVMITGWGVSEPSGFQFTSNCLHGLPAPPSRSTNLVIGPMGSAARGAVTHNVVFNADRQPNVQIGSGHGLRGRLRIRHNTIYGGSLGIYVRGRPRHVKIGSNILGGNPAPAQIRFHLGKPHGIRITNNVAVDAAQLFRPEVRKIVHGFGNVVLSQDPDFEDTSRCSGFRSGLDALIPYGAFAP